MTRWPGGARERLQEAAFAAFAERGFAGATVAEIAEAAGLTERTFFRHFSDKAEVLFAGQDDFREQFTSATRAMAGAPLHEIVAHILRTVSEHWFGDERRPFAAARSRIIEADAALRERETGKLNLVARTIAEALVTHGTPAELAATAGEGCMLVFRIAFARWIADGERRSLATLCVVVADELRTVVDPASTAPAASAQHAAGTVNA